MAMWRPPQRIRYAPHAGPWPTAAEAQSARLFTPMQAGPLSLAARTWVPAMVPWRATEDGFVSDNVLAWYERFARGRPAAIVVEATGIRDIPSGPLLRIGDDRFLPGLRQLVDVVRRASEGETRLLIQLIDFLRIRRRPEPAKYFERILQVNDRHRQALGLVDGPEDQVRRSLAELDEPGLERVLSVAELEALRFGARERVTDIELDAIRELPSQLPELFAAAARRAREAGFDGVELHYAHAYTMASFLSGLNTRSDGYGGSAQARVRLPHADGGGCGRRLWRRRRLLLCERARSRRHGLHLAVPRRQVRRCEATQGRRGGLSLYGAERLRVHALLLLGRARTVWPQSATRR